MHLCSNFLRFREGNIAPREFFHRSSGREIGRAIYGDLGRLRYTDSLNGMMFFKYR